MDIEDNNIDVFLKRVVKTTSLEIPSAEFMPSLMDKINALDAEKRSITAIDPIISRNGWVFVGLLITSIFTALFLFDSTALSFPEYDFSFDNIISLYSSIAIPNMFLLGISAFAFFFVIQIFIMKNITVSGKTEHV